MKKILYSIVCMLLFGSAYSDSDIGPNPPEQARQQVTLTFSSSEARTRIAVDEARVG